MQNNPSQEIHTDYKLNDVFKPVNANQLAKSIHYDFVVTQDMFDAFIENHGYSSKNINIDIGAVISSKMSGEGSVDFDTVDAPCSIYIAANTDGWPLYFCGRLLGTDDNSIINTAAYKDSGAYTLEKTRDMLNVYSAYPYKVSSIAGGINFWSTLTAPVIFETPARVWNGLCRVGCAVLNTPLNLASEVGFQIVFGMTMGVYKPTQAPTQTQILGGNYKPAVVFANWTGDPSITTEYEIDSATTTKLGLFQSISETINSYKGTPVIKVNSSQSTALFYASEYTTTALTFTNAEKSKVLTISSNGAVSINNLGGAAGGTIIIQDDGVIVPYKSGDMYLSYSPEKVTSTPSSVVRYSTLENGEFKVHATADSVPAYNLPSTSVPEQGLRPKNSNHIVWNTWYAITANGIFSDDDDTVTEAHDKLIVNPKKCLYVVADSLVDGVVYELDVNIRAITEASEGGVIVTGDSYGGMHAPDLASRDFFIYFYASEGAPVILNRWGSNTSTTYYVRPSFNRVPSSDTQIRHFQGYVVPPVLATGKVYFVKIAGAIYTMGY